MRGFLGAALAVCSSPSDVCLAAFLLGIGRRRRRALGLIRMVIVWIAGIASGLILIGLIQVSVFVFCHKNFLSFADCRLRSFKQTHFFRRLFGFPSIALAEVIRQSIYLERGRLAATRKNHNVFIIHEKLSYRNKNRLIRSIYLLSAPVHLIFSLIYVML